eukprot:TRINITY_DN1474_c0_g1_i1.p1 TRINITY_DN1474_c0_g1~~TRINITY_DN1474_c0_g1_i1.p1  ORF type:complete len:163 (-),score=24.53 TRINITY_DN1474_c0_g1_i1:368-856(-)
MACGSIQGLHFFGSAAPIYNKKLLPNSTINTTFSIRSNKGFLHQTAILCASVDRADIDENPEGIISGEWPENFSLLSYDDLRAYLEPQIFKDKMQPSALLGDVMSAIVASATADQTLEEIDHHFEYVSGLPVIDEEFRCIGVLSKKDKQRASNGLKSKMLQR